MSENLGTYAKNTWCIGCGNFGILTALKSVFGSLADEGTPLENIVLLAGIGCHAKITDYVNVNTFYSIHGRVPPPAQGIKLANPDLVVIGCAGDGDAYGEGIEHLIFAAKRNANITMLIHNNRVYGLTTGQYTPTSPLGFIGRSTPKGSMERPLNPLEVMLSSGATFVARAASQRMDSMKSLIKQAILHKGFSIVDILQVCVTYNNLYEYYDKKLYDLKEHDPSDYDKAMQKIRQWDYNSDSPIALGVFYKKEESVFEEGFTHSEKMDDATVTEKIATILKKRI